MGWRAWVAAAAVCVWGMCGAAQAGQLILKNSSSRPIVCTVDGWTRGSGAPFDWYIQVQPNVPFYVGQNTDRPGSPVINCLYSPLSTHLRISETRQTGKG